jgi:thiol-disulfide isomerase/thioredoxin
MKKNIFYCLLLLIIPCTAYEQTKTDSSSAPVPAYKKNNSFPTFSLLRTDSTSFSTDNLPKNKPVVLVYFSTECGHCQLEAQELSKSMDKFKEVTFLFVGFHHSVSEIKTFGEKYGLSKFNNIWLCKEAKFFLISYYYIEFTPFIAIYDSNKKFVKEFRNGAKPEELAEALQL